MERRSSYLDSRNRHRNELRWQIIAPVAAVPIVIGLILIIAAVRMTPTQFSVVTNCLSVFIFIPLIAVCGLPVYALLFLSVFGAARLNHSASGLLTRSFTFLTRLYTFTLRNGMRIARPIIGLNRTYTGVSRAINGFFKRRFPMVEKEIPPLTVAQPRIGENPVQADDVRQGRQPDLKRGKS